MHAAVTVILDCLSATMYSLQWGERERDGCGAHEQTGAVFGSLRTHTHSTTPLHFTPLQQYYMGATTLELHASLVGPHYSHL